MDPQVVDRLFMDNIGPGGDVLAGCRRSGGAEAAADRGRAWVQAYPYASTVEVAEVRSRERAKAAPRSVPYFVDATDGH